MRQAWLWAEDEERPGKGLLIALGDFSNYFYGDAVTLYGTFSSSGCEVILMGQVYCAPMASVDFIR
jgi:hypothetical protein